MDGHTGTRRIRRALISVSDKTGLVEFARGLRERGIEIVSTGGTAAALRAAGVVITEVSVFTGSPEILDGRVKTLHPRVHGGILFRRDSEEHLETCREHDIEAIDLVAVNLYPFRETVRRPGVTPEEAIEQIDIGGPTLLRSAAKNHDFVTVVCRPELYGEVLAELAGHDGGTTLALRSRLALEAFRHTAAYDAAIARYLAAGQPPAPAAAAREGARPALPEELAAVVEDAGRKDFDLRYGENSHQAAAFYGDFGRHFDKLHGLELSYNNILDLSAAVELIEEFPAAPAAAVIKHTNPCGVALGSTVLEAWERALAADEMSAHGGVVAFNRPLDREPAAAIHPFFTEIIAAPDFAPAAIDLLREKKNRRLVRLRAPLRQGPRWRLRSAAGGLLVQEADLTEGFTAGTTASVPTRRRPSADELEALAFAWKVVKHVKSNAIAFTGRDRGLGIGAGQMSRLDAVEVAVMKARRAGIDLRGSVAASDAFFPFADGLLACADAGATAVIQPGGARKDAEVIAAADERGIAMVFTGERHFRH
jgi:phosphoribosylaminoimidazolecarboxamide formyltransferase/IMP cyclohydrolase